MTLPFPHLSGPKYRRWFAGVRMAQLGGCDAKYTLTLSIARAKTNEVYP